MCGIAAVLSPIDDNANGIARLALKRLQHRGPDGFNHLTLGGSPRVYLGHTRLSIVGGETAVQPLCWESDNNKRWYLAHNGQLYNHKALKASLIKSKKVAEEDFKTDGDSEVLLAALATSGLEWTLARCRGMFAFVLVECNVISSSCEQVETVVLCRDTFGIKPLCYTSFGNMLIISSEVQVMPTGSKCPQDVLPSTYLVVSTNEKGSSWSFEEHNYDARPSLASTVSKCALSEEYLTRSRELLIDSVKARLPAKDGAKYAILLSGGVDSSLICRIVADEVYPDSVHAFTVTCSDSKGDDSAYASLVAKECENIEHHIISFTTQEALDILPKVVKCLESSDGAMVRAAVPLYLLSRHISRLGIKVLLCGEGADELFGGYRLYESYQPGDTTDFKIELNRRLKNIDTSELQRVDRCTAAHGLEARVPFLDIHFAQVALELDPKHKLSHPSLGRISKYALRNAFDEERFVSSVTTRQLLPNSVLQDDLLCLGLQEIRSNRRRASWRKNVAQGSDKTGRAQPRLWFPVSEDKLLTQMNLTKDEVNRFVVDVLGWSHAKMDSFRPSLQGLNSLITSMLERVPFHNLTLLTRERRPPTPQEMKMDMMTGIGGPCAVVNSFFSIVLDLIGFGPSVYLLSCDINGRVGCHVAILVQIKGLRFFVDVANAKPYAQAIHLADSSVKDALGGSFKYNLRYATCGQMELHHNRDETAAITFDPTRTATLSSFQTMIARSRTESDYGPFLTGLRYCIFPGHAARISAVRDACIIEGSSILKKRRGSSRADIVAAVKKSSAHISGFERLVVDALRVLDRQHPDWFETSSSILAGRGVAL